MAEAGLARRIAPAVVLAAAGGVFLYLLPSGTDEDTGAEDLSATETTSSAPALATAPAAGGSPAAQAQAPTTITGDPVDFRFGTIQVAVTLDGSTITDIQTLTAPGGGYQRFTDRAVPTMKARILKAQSTHVAAASGATYTSAAYAKSVQSALDRA